LALSGFSGLPRNVHFGVDFMVDSAVARTTGAEADLFMAMPPALCHAAGALHSPVA